MRKRFVLSCVSEFESQSFETTKLTNRIHLEHIKDKKTNERHAVQIQFSIGLQPDSILFHNERCYDVKPLAGSRIKKKKVACPSTYTAETQKLST